MKLPYPVRTWTQWTVDCMVQKYRYRTQTEFNCPGWLSGKCTRWRWKGKDAISYYHQPVHARFIRSLYRVCSLHDFQNETGKFNLKTGITSIKPVLWFLLDLDPLNFLRNTSSDTVRIMISVSWTQKLFFFWPGSNFGINFGNPAPDSNPAGFKKGTVLRLHLICPGGPRSSVLGTNTR
jgi:hypothetical protein